MIGQYGIAIPFDIIFRMLEGDISYLVGSLLEKIDFLHVETDVNGRIHCGVYDTGTILQEASYIREYFEKGLLSDEDETSIFELVESYIFRRMICDLPTNSLNKIFLTLHREILQYDGTLDNYLEKFKCALQSKTEKAYRFY